MQNINYEGLSNQFEFNFCQEKDFKAKEAFLCKARREKLKMVGESNTKMAIGRKMGGDGQECLGK
jgi:hypothetical protein